jgi:hypothetical protein
MDAPDHPEMFEGTLTGDLPYRLTRTRLGDLTAGTLLTRRPVHQLVAELIGADASDVVTGLALRSTRTLDPVLAERLVWRVEILPIGGD